MEIFILTLLFLHSINCRIHHLKLIDDDRHKIDISTFGYLKNGYLQVHVNLTFNNNKRINKDAIRNSFSFILEKTSSGGFSMLSNNKDKKDFCSIQSEQFFSRKGVISFKNSTFNTPSSSMIIMNLDLMNKTVKIDRLGNTLQDLKISEKFHIKNELEEDSAKEEEETQTTVKQFDNKTNESSSVLDEAKEFEEDSTQQLSLNINEEYSPQISSISFKFEIQIKTSLEEGLYLLHFYNCYNYLANANLDDVTPLSVNLSLYLTEKNDDSYLSAGEIPVPILYLTWAIIYFLATISWIYILKTSKGEVYKIHYLMLSLVMIKSISLTFHSINLHYIALEGRHETIWAILFYITYVLRGLLMIISILLVGTGWTFIKNILTENERRLFVIVVPLQILAITAYIFLEEKEEGEAIYITWRQLFFLLDLICCGAIIFPIVWSIRHLEQSSKTDGKAAVSLKKLKIFKHFYIMVICYIYFTRIIGYLLKLTVPFRYEWLDKLSTESVTFLFFALTAFKFQPAVNNPYLQLSQDEYSLDNDYDAEMNEISNLDKNPSLSNRKKLIDFNEEDDDEEV